MEQSGTTNVLNDRHSFNYSKSLTKCFTKPKRVWAPKTGRCRLVFGEKFKDVHVAPIVCLAGRSHSFLLSTVCMSRNQKV